MSLLYAVMGFVLLVVIAGISIIVYIVLKGARAQGDIDSHMDR